MATDNLSAPCPFAQHRPIVTAPHWSIGKNGRAQTTCRTCGRQIERLPPDGDGGWQWWGTPEQVAAVEKEEREAREYEANYDSERPEDRCPPRE